jgi:hypothetical protein
MADHLAAGGVRDAEIAIQEEVAQTPARKFGVGWFDVGKFADDRVLIHLNTSTARFARSRQSPASNFLAARIGAFEPSLCYAKITPATLQRAGFGKRTREHAEAVGPKSKFGLSVFQSGVGAAAEKVVKTPRMAAS